MPCSWQTGTLHLPSPVSTSMAIRPLKFASALVFASLVAPAHANGLSDACTTGTIAAFFSDLPTPECRKTSCDYQGLVGDCAFPLTAFGTLLGTINANIKLAACVPPAQATITLSGYALQS